MDKKQVAGTALIVTAVLLFAQNIATELKHVQYWQDAAVTIFTPSFVADSAMQLIMLLSGTVGGNFLPTMKLGAGVKDDAAKEG